MRRFFILLSILAAGQNVYSRVTIKAIKGDVQVRRGMDEEWQPASGGTELEDLDTILCLEGNVTLLVDDNVTFDLGSHSILDISDLRRITKREMFLYLMSEKVKNIKPAKNRAKLQVGSVSVVHGESKQQRKNFTNDSITSDWRLEHNGGVAMFRHGLYANTIVKLVKIQKKYAEIDDCGEIDFYIARAFQELDEAGQAVDRYERVLERSKACDDPDSRYRYRQAERAKGELELR
ncbi:hypothetical protein JW935_16310 [candidate division KSB1 bacterium]|nr:hypothetical protein [candidate division KSB1 bacterium]